LKCLCLKQLHFWKKGSKFGNLGSKVPLLGIEFQTGMIFLSYSVSRGWKCLVSIKARSWCIRKRLVLSFFNTQLLNFIFEGESEEHLINFICFESLWLKTSLTEKNFVTFCWLLYYVGNANNLLIDIVFPFYDFLSMYVL